MGYTTEFKGKGFNITPALTPTQAKYINTFSGSRRMKRNSEALMGMYKGKHGLPYHFVPTEEMKELVEKLEALDLTVTIEPKKDPRKTAEEFYGIEGEYFAKDSESDPSILEYNTPPGQLKGFVNREENTNLIKEGKAQPGLWCQWVVNPDRNNLHWDGGEKFYNYIEWLKYLIDRFFIPWGVVLNGELEWIGDDSSDRGKIVVEDNEVRVKTAKVVYED